MTAPILIKFPYTACVFYQSLDTGDNGIHEGENEVAEWCEAVIPGRYVSLMGGDHEFEFSELDEVFGPWNVTWVQPYQFLDRDAFMLFKLRWGGDA